MCPKLGFVIADHLNEEEEEEGASQSASEFSSVLQAAQTTSVKNFDVPLCCVCLEDR